MPTETVATSEGSEVTFVGGRAVEQTDSPDSSLEADERETAKAAVRKAIQEAGESAASEAKEGKAKDPYKPPGATREPSEGKDTGPESPERGPDGKFLPKDGKPSERKELKGDEETIDMDKASVKQMLKAREKVAALKKQASGVNDEISHARNEFHRQQQEFQKQQHEFAQAQAHLQRQYQALQALRSDPARAIREVGYDPEQFIMDLANEGTPEGKAQRQFRELQQQIEEMKSWRQEEARRQQEYQQQAQRQQVVQARRNAVQNFVSLGMSEDKYPHVATFYKGHEKALVARGDLAAEDFRSLSGGREGSYEDILDYIEDQLAEAANTWYSKKSGVGKSPRQETQAQEKPKSKGKSLNPSASGERRSLQAKDLRDLDGDERLEAAKQAVAIALANSKE